MLDYVRRFASGDALETSAKHDGDSDVSSIAYYSDDDAENMEL